jgi:Trp operon repressor
MISFYELIEKIKQRPALYLGKAALSQFQTFLDGYTFALRQVNIPVSQEEQEFEQFQEWIETRFNQPSTQHWSRIILFYSEDERDALDRFFELFNEFINEKKPSSSQLKSEVMSKI